MQTEPTTALDALRDGTTSLGIELGSTRIKAVLVDDDGTPIASGNAAWENELRDGFWTYSLDAVHEGLQRAYASLADDCERQWGARPQRIGAIGVSGMMHGYLAFDADGSLLVPFRTWRNATTARAAELLTAELGVRMPLRWSASHLLQAVLDDEEHVGRLAAITTLAGYVHRLLGGAPVLGPDDASGMFPLAPSGTEYDAELLAAFDALAARHGAEGLRIADLLPQVRTAGDDAGSLSDAGARLLDATGALQAGAALCPPEGDAGTGMVATGALAPGTGNVSVGTSIFAMIVLDAVPTGEPLDADIVATPGGKPSAMVHCDNGTAELGAWAGLFGQFAAAAGVTLAPDEVFAAMLGGSAGGSVDELVAYGFISGEHAIHLPQGRPLVARRAGADLTLAGFAKAQLLGAFGALRLGMQQLTDTGVRLDELVAHGGVFRTPGAAQPLLAATLDTPVRVTPSAGEGGAWGMALLARYRLDRIRGDERALEDWLLDRGGIDPGTVEQPDARLVEECAAYHERWQAALPLARLAPDVLA
ncbi:FGGY-family carbohydrate kinase [Agrococcus jenensis]|uniref:Sugar (Pentulose or hexulose) kinase n=1 Tax=Agrococcus jenensis TaxID=46353 RepID=A0A3N2AUV0_9MICO|nr:FGGY-family carbohydrate kinase [Agrococcus jenensis]ROR66811.1 sugar (pentulose or hexulose) kinase [Agrococcus jenensis]